MTKKDFTLETTKIHGLFLSDGYRKDLRMAFGVRRWNEITDGQWTLCVHFLTVRKFSNCTKFSLSKSRKE